MAGSRKWFRYTDDAGDEFALQLDESNTEAVMAGATDEGDYLDTSTVTQTLPRLTKPRTVVYANAERTREITCTVLDSVRYNEIVAGTEVQTIVDPVAGTGNLVLIRANGESRRIPFAQDTGLTDGDAT